MPRLCSVCTHPDLAEITKSISSGGSNRKISDRYKVTVSAVQRHRVEHLKAPRRVKETAASSEASSAGGSIRFESTHPAIEGPKDLLTRLSTLFRLSDLLEEAIQRKDIDAVVKLARELRATAESYAKVAGWLVEGSGNTTLIDARRQSITMLSKLTNEELRRLAAGDPIAALPAPVGETIEGGAVLSSHATGDAGGA